MSNHQNPTESQQGLTHRNTSKVTSSTESSQDQDGHSILPGIKAYDNPGKQCFAQSNTTLTFISSIVGIIFGILLTLCWTQYCQFNTDTRQTLVNGDNNDLNFQQSSQSQQLEQFYPHPSLSIYDSFIPQDKRTYRQWTSKPVPLDLIQKAYNTIRYGPTAFNSSPLRLALLTNPESKKLFTSISAFPPAHPSILSSPLTIILAWDSQYDRYLDVLAPNAIGPKKMLQNPENSDKKAKIGQFNAALQAGFFITALRSLGLDLGPATSFDMDKFDEIFFGIGQEKDEKNVDEKNDGPEGNEQSTSNTSQKTYYGTKKTSTWRSFMLLNIGYGDRNSLGPRNERLHFSKNKNHDDFSKNNNIDDSLEKNNSNNKKKASNFEKKNDSLNSSQRNGDNDIDNDSDVVHFV